MGYNKQIHILRKYLQAVLSIFFVAKGVYYSVGLENRK